MGKISGINLSKYIINYSLKKGYPISNLQLQKILYFVNIEFYKEKKEFLLEEPFYAYPLGPVNKNVYNIYKAYGASKIYSQSDVILNISKNDKTIIDQAIDKYIKMSAFQLVNLSHRENSAWDITRKKKGMYNIIDTKLMEQEII